MDSTTEPILVVIGHPIAGNPAQFAAERALRSLKLDWRVVSFDVQPENVAVALEGFAVTGIHGVIIDRSLAREAQQWYAQQTGSEQAAIDCLSRDDAFQFVGDHEQRRWVDDQVTRHGGQHLLWIGEYNEQTPASAEGFEQHATAPANLPELATHADVIVINQSASGPIELDAEEWPANDGSTLVIDLTDGHPDLPRLKQLGYRVLGENERRIGTLQRCLQRWTGQVPATEVIYDAIEEYLGV
jgi:hypothetical protein